MANTLTDSNFLGHDLLALSLVRSYLIDKSRRYRTCSVFYDAFVNLHRALGKYKTAPDGSSNLMYAGFLKDRETMRCISWNNLGEAAFVALHPHGQKDVPISRQRPVEGRSHDPGNDRAADQYRQFYLW